eukprot:jgi/Psemu1/22392/gm1.22392_g
MKITATKSCHQNWLAPPLLLKMLHHSAVIILLSLKDSSHSCTCHLHMLCGKDSTPKFYMTWNRDLVHAHDSILVLLSSSPKEIAERADHSRTPLVLKNDTLTKFDSCLSALLFCVSSLSQKAPG